VIRQPWPVGSGPGARRTGSATPSPAAAADWAEAGALDLAITLLADEEGHRQQFEGYLKEYTKG